MFFILVMTVTSYNIITIAKDVAQIAGTGGWISILIVAFIFGLGSSYVLYVNSHFSGKMLFDYVPQIIGKPGAYILVLYYILYFSLILVFFIDQKSKILRESFFPNTPLWSFPLLGIPIFCYVAYKGVSNVARLTEIIGTVFIFTGTLVHIIMITQGRVNRILPLYNPEEIPNYIKALKPLAFAFAPPSIMFAFPISSKTDKKSIRTAFLSILFIGLFYILIVESSIMKVGINDIINYKNALIMAIRDTAPRGLEFFARLDILYLTIGFSGMFTGISVILTALLEFICRIFPRAKRLNIIIIIGIIIYGLILIISGINNYEKYVKDTFFYLSTISSIIIPGIIFLIIKIKYRKKVRTGDT